ncbi:flavodoxin family protein, partial [Mycobacterium tuberculosis]
PYVVHRTGKVDEAAFARITKELGQRLDTLFTADPIPFRRQNAGDYEIPALTLREDIAPGKTGFAAHTA